MILNYAQLVNDYVENLHTNLRNFKQGPDFLDTWGHDEDHNASIVGIFESASEAQITDVTLAVESSLAKDLNLEWIKQYTNKLGSLIVKKDGESLLLKLELTASKDSFKIHPVYQSHVVAVSKQISYEGSLNVSGDGQFLFKANEGPVTLSCLVDVNSNILDARHSGATAVTRVLLDQLCSLIVGRPVQEASDHGVIRLEYKLRDKTLPRPVPGLLTPDNADPAFRVPVLLARKIFTQFLETQKVNVGRNFWDDKAGASWLGLSNDERISRCEAALSAACKQMGLQEVGVEVVEIKDDVRVVLSYVQDPHRAKLGDYLIKLERALKDSLDARLEIQLESLTDKNKRKERSIKLFKH